MRVYRISAPRYVSVALTGGGAARVGARWNSRGVRMGYTAQSESLAKLEMLVHVDREDVPVGHRVLVFDIPDDATQRLAPLPADWQMFPYTAGARAAGDLWIAEGRSLALRVPSVMAREEWNILVNPAHARFGEIRLVANEPLAFDPRLFE